MSASTTRWNRGALSFMAAIAIWLVGCVSIGEMPDPTRAIVTVRVEPGASPDLRGRDLPVVVRIFQVKAPGEFEQSDFFELMDRSPTLAVDGYQLLDELEMVSGEERRSQHEFDSAAGYIGAIAAFRQINGAKWLDIAPVAAEKLNEVTVEIRRLQVDISSQNVQ